MSVLVSDLVSFYARCLLCLSELPALLLLEEAPKLRLAVYFEFHFRIVIKRGR